MKTGFYQGNTFDQLETAEYDYVFTSPPCFEGLSSFGVDIKKPHSYELKFLCRVIPFLKPKLGTITVAFTGLRRHGGRIINKSYMLEKCMAENDYYLRDVKRAKKGNAYNAYSHQGIDVMTFQKHGTKSLNNLQRDKLYHSYGLDFWGPFTRELLIDGEVVGQPVEIASMCIQMFTNENHLVFDPFAGIGSTLAAADRLNRTYLGYELRPKIHMAGIEKFGLNAASFPMTEVTPDA